MGINAIAVIDAKTHEPCSDTFPTAWYPYRVTLSPDGSHMAGICFRGFGNGPKRQQGPSQQPIPGDEGRFQPARRPLRRGTEPIISATCSPTTEWWTGAMDRPVMCSPVVPTESGKTSKEIKYVVFITKENHTYDTIFDHIPGANDNRAAAWGLHQTIRGKGQPTLKNVAVMINHNALARQFTVSDNFYMEPEASGVGHRWLVGVQPNNLMQMTYTVGWKFSGTARLRAAASHRLQRIDGAGGLSRSRLDVGAPRPP